MKIGGKKLEGINVEPFVLPRATGDIVFQLQAVPDMSGFLAICPEPEVPISVNAKTGKKAPDPDSEDYLKALGEWAGRKYRYIQIQSLAATKELEWELVDVKNPETWDLVPKELKAAGLTDIEIARLLGAINAVQGLNDTKFQEALDRFVLRQKEALAEDEAKTSRKLAQSSM